VSRQTHRHLDTDQAGTLAHGDEFKFQPGGPGTTWQVFTFHAHVVTGAGGEWVTCFGGDPIRPQQKHDRAWRAFAVDRIRKEAQPPGDLASGRRRVA
jgi:hypothetical protein